jgi:hypothetical protein
LAALHQSAFAPSLGTPWDEAAFANLLRQNSVQALGTQAGFILFQTVAEEAEILTLAVHPKARRSGFMRLAGLPKRGFGPPIISAPMVRASMRWSCSCKPRDKLAIKEA